MTFENFLTAGRPDPIVRRSRRRALAGALALHAVLLVGAVVRAGWHVDELRPSVQPIVIAPFAAPAPSEPPAPARARPRSPARKTPRAMLPVPAPDPVPARTQPTADQPAVPTGPETTGAGLPGDGEGPPCEGPCPGTGSGTFIAPEVARGQLAIDPHAEPYRVKLPPALNRAGMRFWLLAKLCVRPDGQVERVILIRGADPALDPLALATLRTWRYRPYAVNGRPVPFCTNVRYEIAAQ